MKITKQRLEEIVREALSAMPTNEVENGEKDSRGRVYFDPEAVFTVKKSKTGTKYRVQTKKGDGLVHPGDRIWLKNDLTGKTHQQLGSWAIQRLEQTEGGPFNREALDDTVKEMGQKIVAHLEEKFTGSKEAVEEMKERLISYLKTH